LNGYLLTCRLNNYKTNTQTLQIHKNKTLNKQNKQNKTIWEENAIQKSSAVKALNPEK